MIFKKFLVLAAFAFVAVAFTGCVNNATPDEASRIPNAQGEPLRGGGLSLNGIDDLGGGDDWVTPSGGGPITDGPLADTYPPGWEPLPNGPELPVIYFDFDRDVIKNAEAEKIQQVANYMLSEPALALIIEGHTDDVGTNEYNRALGERRAIAVLNALASQGVAADRMCTVSMGEDIPAAGGTDSQARALNRRGMMIPAVKNQ